MTAPVCRLTSLRAIQNGLASATFWEFTTRRWFFVAYFARAELVAKRLQRTAEAKPGVERWRDGRRLSAYNELHVVGHVGDHGRGRLWRPAPFDRLCRIGGPRPRWRPVQPMRSKRKTNLPKADARTLPVLIWLLLSIIAASCLRSSGRCKCGVDLNLRMLRSTGRPRWNTVDYDGQ